jgi:hypothetical protein
VAGLDITTIGIAVDSRQVKTAAGDLDKLGRSGENAAKGADAVNAKYKQMGMIVGAAMAGAAVALGAFVKSQINAADAASKTAQQIGVNIKSLTALQHAADLSGVSHQSLADSLAKFNRSISEASQLSKSASQAFADLGININDSNGTLKSTEVLLLEVADQFAKYENSATKTAMAQELFGRSGAALIPLLNQGSKGIQDMMKQAELLGLVIDQKTATAAENFNDSLTVLKASSVGIARQVVAELAPTMTELAGIFVDVATETSLAEMAAKGLAVAFKAVITVALAVGTAFTYAGERIGAVAAAFVLAAKGEFAQAWEVIKQNSQDSSETIAKGIERISKLWSGDYAESGASAIALHGTLNRTQEEGAKTTQKLTEAEKQYQQVLSNRLSAQEEIETLRQVNELLKQGLEIEEARFIVESARKGLLPEQVKELIKQRDIQAEILSIEDDRRKRIQLAIKAHEDETKAIADAAKERARINQKASDDHLREIARENDRIQREFEKTADSIRQSLTDALMRGFEDGKTFAENFKQTLINMFKTLILRPIIEFIVSPISGAISGVISNIFGGGGGSLLGGTGSMGSIFTQGKTLLTAITDGFTGLNNSLTSAIGNLGTFLSTGTGGLGDVLGGFIGQYSSQIAGILPYAGAALSLISGDVKGAAFQAAGAAIGSAIGGPVGGFIGSALGSVVGGLFGGSGEKYKQVIQQRYGTYQDGRFSPTQGLQKRTPDGSATAFDELNKRFSQNLSAILSAFGFDGPINTMSYGRIRRTSGRFASNFSAAFDGGSVDFNKQFGAKGDFGKGFEKFAGAVLGEVLVKAIQQSSLPANIRALFDGMTDADKVAQMINAAVTLGRANDALVERFGLTADAAAGVAKATGYMGDELTAFVAKLGMTGLSMQKASVSILQARDELTKSLNKVFGTISFEEVTKTITEKVRVSLTNVYSGLDWGTSFNLFQSPLTSTYSNILSSFGTKYEDVTKTVVELVAVITSVNIALPQTIDAFDQLLKSIDTTTEAGKEMFANVFELRDAFMAYTSAIDGLKTGVNDAIYSMLSPAEQLAQNQADLAEMFGKLNLAVPTSIEQLIALGRSIDYGTESGLDLAMAFPILVQAFQQAEAGVVALAGSLGLLNKNNFSNVIDFNRAQAYLNNGIPLSQLPSYDVGTSYVPKDGPAMLHRGEAVLTASENRSRSSDGGVVAEIRALRAEIIDLKRASAETAKNTKRTSDTLLNVSRGGDSIFTEAA